MTRFTRDEYASDTFVQKQWFFWSTELPTKAMLVPSVRAVITARTIVASYRRYAPPTWDAPTTWAIFYAPASKEK